MATPKLLDINEAASLLHTTPATLRYWRYKRQGPPAAVIGKRVMYREADIERYIEQQFEDAAS